MQEIQTQGRVIGSIEAAGEVEVERSLVGAVNAHAVEIEQSIAGAVMAGGDVSIRQAGCGPVLAAGNVTITQGGCGPLLAKGNVTFEQGGCQSVLAAGGVRVSRGFVGIAISPNVTVEEGGRVLMGLREAAVFGAALGLGLFALLARRRRD